MVIWRLPGRQLKAPSGIIGKCQFWAKSWPGAFWSQIWAICGASRPAIKSAFWDHWETARFGLNPGQEPFGAKFWAFGGLPGRQLKAPLELLGNGPFSAKSGTGAFWSPKKHRNGARKPETKVPGFRVCTFVIATNVRVIIAVK